VTTIALRLGAKSAALGVLFPGSIPLGRTNAWVGSPRIRRLIVEMVWRLPLFQPNYPPILQWRELLCGKNKVLKKKAAVAVGRRLLIDIWKMRTGRTTAQELDLILNPPPSR